MTELKTIRTIIENHFSVDLKSKSREGRLPDKRKIYSMLASKHIPATLQATGKEINCHYATVITQIQKGKDLYSTDKAFKAKFDEIEALLPDFKTQMDNDTRALKNRLILIEREADLIREELIKRSIR